MNIKRAKEEIKNTIEAYLLKDRYGAYEIPAIRQRPVLLIGPPGIGKTQIMEQISRECQIGLVAYTITHHTRQSAVGLPFIEKKNYAGREYAVTEYTMSEIVASIYDKIEDSGLKEGILFIDEINCVSETLAPTMLQFLQCKTFGNHKIPEGWIIVAAGNPPEFNKSVREFDIVTLDRIKMIHVEADLTVWKEYAEQVNIHPAIRSYLEVKPQNFCQIETTVDGKQFATPRGWEDLSRLIEVYERLGKTADREVIGQYLQHPRIAKDFANYLELYDKYQKDYRVEEILEGRVRPGVYEKLDRAPFDERLSVISLLLAALNNAFRELAEEEARMQRLQSCLKKLNPQSGTQTDGRTLPERLQALIRQTEEERERREEAGLLSRGEDHLYRDTLQELKRFAGLLTGEMPEPQAWETITEAFGLRSDAYEALSERCGEKLEHAFDFVEAAFETGQETVVFVNGLNSGFYSISFLQDYECERYYRYNKQFLFEDQEQDILDAIRKKEK